VVARTGRAEVLKSQNCLEESLLAYEETLAEFPTDVVARTGKAGVLVGLERWDEALSLLSEAPPVTRDDWIGFHVRGMIYLRTSRLREAIQIFERGVETCPRPADRDYFRAALALVRIQEKAYEKVEETLENVIGPSLEAPVNVLRFHALGALGRTRRAAEAWERLRPVENLPGYREVGAELRSRYLDKTGARQPDDWLIHAEMKLLLAA